MGNFVINGGNKLDGKIRIESAKNAVLPLLAGSILTNEQVVIKNCPKIQDVLSLTKILNLVGAKTFFVEQDLVIDPSDIKQFIIGENLTGLLRSSIYLMGALISRLKKVKICFPGGCKIGDRPIDIHIDGLRQMGVKIVEENNELSCSVDKIKGITYTLKFASVGATVNLILASVFCEGTTTLINVAREPEIEDLCNFLISMGAKISGGGTSVITIEGVKKLHGTKYKPICDRIEVGTFYTALQIVGGSLELSNCNVKNIQKIADKISNNTCKTTINNDIIYITCSKGCSCVNLTTGPYPSFPTDLQPQVMAYCCTAKGTSVVTESIFENRFLHVQQLNKMGANICTDGRTATIKGVNFLHGDIVSAEDLRGGACLVLAGLGAQGTTVVQNVEHIDRGYLNFDKKLRSVGVDILRR